jgi:enhancing lycopene biosynthesis protein 2
MAARVGVVLSGCGVFDGSEIHEAVSIILALDRRGAQVTFFAPNIPQAQVIDHLSGKPGNEKRNVLVESARIARGKIRDVATASSDELDALIFPGGFGAARNLCDFATNGENCTVQSDVARLMKAMHAAKKPIGLACISPVVAARVFGEMRLHARLTIGSDPATAAKIEAMGAQHQNVGPAEVAVDEANKLVSTPCYMNEVGPWTVYQGAEKMVEEVLRLTGDVASMVRQHMVTAGPTSS